MPDIHITLLNYFMKNDLDIALTGLFADIADCPYDVAVTVADNSQNQDGLKDMIQEKFPKAVYLDCGGNLGMGKGYTRGLKRVEARYYFALNPDTEFLPNTKTIERIVRFMDEHPKIGCIGLKLLNMDGTLQLSCYRFDFLSLLVKPLKHLRFDEKYRWAGRRTKRLMMLDFDHEKTQPVDWVLGAAMVVRKEVVEKIGWFDERFFMYMEDCDWCRRMWEAGFPVYYVHDIVLKHRHGRDSSKVPGVFNALIKNRLARVHLESWVKFLWKWRKNHKYYADIS